MKTAFPVLFRKTKFLGKSYLTIYFFLPDTPTPNQINKARSHLNICENYNYNLQKFIKKSHIKSSLEKEKQSLINIPTFLRRMIDGLYCTGTLPYLSGRMIIPGKMIDRLYHTVPHLVEWLMDYTIPYLVEWMMNNIIGTVSGRMIDGLYPVEWLLDYIW